MSKNTDNDVSHFAYGHSPTMYLVVRLDLPSCTRLICKSRERTYPTEKPVAIN